MALESYHWRVFVELCLYGVEFRMIGLLRRRLEKQSDSGTAHRQSAFLEEHQRPFSGDLSPPGPGKEGSGFQGLVSWEVG